MSNETHIKRKPVILLIAAILSVLFPLSGFVFGFLYYYVHSWIPIILPILMALITFPFVIISFKDNHPGISFFLILSNLFWGFILFMFCVYLSAVEVFRRDNPHYPSSQDIPTREVTIEECISRMQSGDLRLYNEETRDKEFLYLDDGTIKDKFISMTFESINIDENVHYSNTFLCVDEMFYIKFYDDFSGVVLSPSSIYYSSKAYSIPIDDGSEIINMINSRIHDLKLAFDELKTDAYNSISLASALTELEEANSDLIIVVDNPNLHFYNGLIIFDEEKTMLNALKKVDENTMSVINPTDLNDEETVYYGLYSNDLLSPKLQYYHQDKCLEIYKYYLDEFQESHKISKYFKVSDDIDTLIMQIADNLLFHRENH